MGAGNATFSHGKEQAIIKDQITLSNSAMKSPASPRKNLHVSFTEADKDKVGRDCDSRKNQRQGNVGGYPVSQNVASDYESNEGHSHSSRRDYSRNHTNSYCSTRHSGEDGKDTRESHTSTYYVPTHLPPSHNNANNNYHPNLAYRLSRYDNVDDFAAQKSSMNNQRISPSPRPRSRSASPRRMERMLVANSVKDIKDLTAVLQSDRSSSVSTRKAASISSDSSGIQGAKMTAFSIGRPAKFSPGVYGDLGIFKSISQVNEHLYICGVMALSEEKIKALKIDCVINATLDWPPYQIRGLETMRIQVDDVPSASLSPHFDRVANKVNEVISRGGRVLVHCMAGISRSSTLCIAYLMKYRGFSLQQAYSLMKTKRPLIRPNDGFWRQLVQYEKELKRHKNSLNKPGNKYGMLLL
ncbi:uncharacterized protein [Watersipora subatra]|uniref:uncharacterized protein isoform X2 n=1 Tax=Watersipora subatra TaxID=2589382 RepID=UPI00355AE34A